MASLSQNASAITFRFAGFELDPGRGTLLHHGTRVKLQPQPLRILHHLIAAAPAIVSRDQLAAAVWPDVHVDLDQSLNFCIRQIRTALNDTASHPRFVETLPKQGYRFIATMDTEDLAPAALPDAPTPPPSAAGQPATSRLTASRRLRSRPLLLAIAAAIPTALAVFALVRHPFAPPPTAPPSALPPTAAVAHPARFVLPEAHDAYLRGRYLWFRGANKQAGEAFRRATQLQPDYALAWSGLADYYGAGTLDNHDTLDPRDALPREEAAARRAVQLDKTSANAHLSLGAALYFNRWNAPAAQREIDRALELDPRLAQALHFRARILSSLEQHDQAIAAERAANEIDPFARPWGMAYRFVLARRYEDARQSALEHLRAEPDSRDALKSLEDTDCAEGKLRECVTIRIRRLDLLGDHAKALHLHHIFAQRGFRAVLLSDLADLQQKTARQYVSPFAFAEIYVQLGQRDTAIHSLEEALNQHDPNLLLLQNLALFDPLHEDPRYRSLVRTIGLPPAF